MARLRIVLVEPREAGNVGAVCRAMKNFGFSDLAIVGRRPEGPVPEWWASGAEDVLEQARLFDSLEDAIADAHLAVATSSARGRTREEILEPKEVAETFGVLGDDQVLALVFGRENHGLTQREIAACERFAVIPTNEAFPTMNLAQSVSLFCYEVSRVRPAAPRAPRELAPTGLVERMHAAAKALLEEVGFLHENNPDRIYDVIRTAAGRALLDEREVEIVLGMIRQVRWAVQHAPRARGPETSSQDEQ